VSRQTWIGFYGKWQVYDPNVAVGFWERMAAHNQGQAPPEFLSTHPLIKLE